MAESQAQSTAPESVPQSTPSCEFCGSPIVLNPTENECCHRQAAVHHTLQLDSARNASRHVIVLHKQVDALTQRVAEIEAKLAVRDEPSVMRKVKG